MLKGKITVLLFTAAAAAFFWYLGHFSAQIVYNNRESYAELPIIMYHSVLKDPARSGDYVVTPEQVQEDINYLKEAGYTTVSMSQVEDYVYNSSPLPEKPIMLTFDDGSYNNYGYVLPILEETETHAVFAIVGEYTDEFTQSDIANLSFGYMRWCDVRDMMNSPHSELANHSYAFHSTNKGRNGSKKKPGEASDTYKKIFTDDTEKMQMRFFEETGEAPVIYCYPFGAYSKESLDIIRDLGFKASFSCTEGINILTHDHSCLYLLKRNNRPSGISAEEYFNRVLK